MSKSKFRRPSKSLIRNAAQWVKVFNIIDANEGKTDESGDPLPADIVKDEECYFGEFQLKPATSKVMAIYAEKQGMRHEAETVSIAGKRGNETRARVLMDPEKYVEARVWLGKQLVQGWRDFLDSDGDEIEFSKESRDAVCAEMEFFAPILFAAEELCGQRAEELEKN